MVVSTGSEGTDSEGWIGREGWLSDQARFAVSMAKVLADPLRTKILEELNKRVMSPNQFYNEFGGGSVPRVWRHFQVLVKYGWAVEVEQRSGGSRRGATEHFYKATRPAVFDNQAWALLPDSMKEAFSARILTEMVRHTVEAMEAGTFEADPERHFTCSPFLFDRLGRERALEKVDELFEWLFTEQERARKRFGDTDIADLIPMTVILAAFRSPRDTNKAP